jgi:DNA-binding LacI/PurR family transcriptional regulator
MAREDAEARVTIHDVAKAAGVSPTTVSHALNGRGKVSPATRAHVAAVAKRMAYQPSRVARSLRTARTETLALVLPEFETRVEVGLKTVALDFYMQLIRSAALTAFEYGYRLLIAPEITSQAEAIKLGVDGAMICDPTEGDHQLDFFSAANLPVVTNERPAGRPDFRWHVNADNEGNTRRLLDHLVDGGATRIALVLPDLPSPAIDEFEHAYLSWCEGKFEPMLERTNIEHPDRDAARECVERLLSRSDPPDGILDLAPTSTLLACHAHEVRVPDDLLIAALLDGPETRGAKPPITALDMNPTAVGQSGIGLLVDLIEDRSPEGPIIVPAPLNVRASSQRPRSRRTRRAPNTVHGFQGSAAGE